MLNKTLILIDGENLVLRYQAMLEEGKEPVSGVLHKTDSFIWHGLIPAVSNWDIIRISYYTTKVGDDDSIMNLRKEISMIEYSFYNNMSENRIGTINPHIFKKGSRTYRNKSIDINITIDALRHTYNNSIDTIYLLSGDGDYLPLIEEIMKQGKSVFIGAFSNGLNPALEYTSDDFINLDEIFFKTDNQT